jgi:hypothetical protein
MHHIYISMVDVEKTEKATMKVNDYTKLSAVTESM